MRQRTKTEQAAILLVRELDKYMDDTGGTEQLRRLLAAFWKAWFDEHPPADPPLVTGSVVNRDRPWPTYEPVNPE